MALQGINIMLGQTSEFTRKTTAGAMMLPTLIGACLNTYDKVISPILDVNDKLISKVAPNSAFSEISKSLSDAKEEALGSHIGDYEDLKVIQDKENKRREEEADIASRVANEPKISSF
jgi:hypothetical protein